MKKLALFVVLAMTIGTSCLTPEPLVRTRVSPKVTVRQRR